MSSPDVGFVASPLTLGEGEALAPQINSVGGDQSFDQAFNDAIFTAMSMLLLENLGQLQRDAAEYANS